MKITAKVHGHFLEERVCKIKKKGVKISDNEITVSLEENTSLSELLKILGISDQTGIMCRVNEETPYFDDKLSDGDKVEIILLVDGG